MLFELLNNVTRQINSAKGFEASCNYVDGLMYVSYNNWELGSMSCNLPLILARQVGYNLPIAEMYKTGLEFQSAEEKNVSALRSLLYHKNFYFFTEAVSPQSVRVVIRYFDAPDSSRITDVNAHISKIKMKVKSNPNYQFVLIPNQLDDYKMNYDSDGKLVFTDNYEAFFFTTVFNADTYGDVMLKVDQIIHDLEK